MYIEVNQPKQEEYLGYYKAYVDLAVSKIHTHYLSEQFNKFEHVLQKGDETQQDFAYDDEKWTIRQLLRHIIDAERIFLYRAVAIARGEDQDLPGFDQDDYIDNGPKQEAALSDMVEEFRAARSSTEWFLKNLSDADWKRIGSANGAMVSVRALAYVLIGHTEHHYNIFKDRYLTALS